MQKKENYETDDFYLSVWLLSRGFVPSAEWRGQDSGRKPKAYFVFPDVSIEEIQRNEQEFRQDEVVQEFKEGIKRLKDILYKDKEPTVYS